MYGYTNSSNLELQNKNFYSFSEVAKLINIKGFGRNKILKVLREKEIIYKSNGCYYSKWEYEYQHRYFETNKRPKVVENVKFNSILVSKKGVDFIRSLLTES